MKKFCLLIFIIYSLTSVLQAKEDRSQIRRLIPLKSSSIEYILDYDAGYDLWAESTAAYTESYIPALEEYLRIPFPRKIPFTLFGRHVVLYDGPEPEKQGTRVGGLNMMDYVAVEYEISPRGNPSLLFHEIGHYWYGYTDSGYDIPAWLIEGIVSFLPVAMIESGFLSGDDRILDSVMVHWGINGIRNFDPDRSLENDFRFDDWKNNSGLFYMKTFFLQYRIFLELGPDKYRTFLQELLARRSTFTEDDDIFDLLETLSGTEWRKELSGWVYPGDYNIISIYDFQDHDSDSILSAREIFLGTDPYNPDSDGDLLPDGVELAEGSVPVSPDPENYVLGVIEKFGPFPDGLPSEWDRMPYYYAHDPEGDSDIGGYDIGKTSLSVRRNKLYILVETRTAPTAVDDVFFDVLIDLDNDSNSDLDAAFYLSGPSNPWLYDSAAGTPLPHGDMKGGRGTGLELSIPLELIGREKFKILPIVRDHVKGFNHDVFDFWIPIDQDILAALDNKGLVSDLVTDDADGDLIPDIYEIRGETDPAQPDGRATLIKLGPFPDGMGSEWPLMDTGTMTDVDSDKRPAGYDISEFHWVFKGNSLFFSAFPSESFSRGKEIMFDLLVDVDGNYSSDLEFAFYLDNPDNPWMYDTAKSQSSSPPGLASAMVRIIEIAVPLEFLPDPPFSVYPIIMDLKTREILEAPANWFMIGE